MKVKLIKDSEAHEKLKSAQYLQTKLHDYKHLVYRNKDGKNVEVYSLYNYLKLLADDTLHTDLRIILDYRLPDCNYILDALSYFDEVELESSDVSCMVNLLMSNDEVRSVLKKQGLEL